FAPVRQTLGRFVPDDYPIIRTQPATAAKVRIATALMQPHDAVHAAGQQLGDVQIGTESAIGQQNLTGLQQMPKPASERDILMVLIVVSHLQKRSTLQAEKADHFELRKTTAGLLAAILRPPELVGSRIWHREPRAIDNFDASAQPELLVGDLAFELLGHLGANLLEHCLIKPGASLTVAAGITRGEPWSGKCTCHQALIRCKASRQEEPGSKT